MYYLYSIKYLQNLCFQLDSQPSNAKKFKKMINLIHLNDFAIPLFILQKYYFIFNHLLKSTLQQLYLLQIVAEKLTIQIQSISYFAIN